MKWIDPGRQRWDNRVMDRAQDRYWRTETRIIFHLCCIIAPLLVLAAVITTAEMTPIVSAICIGLVAFAAAALGLLVRRARRHDFDKARIVPPRTYITEEELAVDEDSRRKAFENLKRYDEGYL